MSDESRGVQNPNRIDFIFRDKDVDAYILAMIEHREWSESDDQLRQLKAKVETYMAFILDGHMAQQVPASRGKPVRILLDMAHEPGPTTSQFLSDLKAALHEHDIEFSAELQD